jgi:hypothetical protein
MHFILLYPNKFDVHFRTSKAGKTLRYFTLVLEGFDVFPVTIELLSSIDILSYD